MNNGIAIAQLAAMLIPTFISPLTSSLTTTRSLPASIALVIAIGVAALWPSRAAAQTDNRLAVGASVTSSVATSDAAGSSATVGLEMRLGHETEEWGWQTSFFSWFDTDVTRQTPLPNSQFGQLRVRPVMIGYGYGRSFGRVDVTIDVVGGIAFNSFHLDSATIAQKKAAGATDIHGESTNSLAIKPEVQLWYDLNRRWGLRMAAGYLITRPTVSVSSTLGEDRLPFRADSLLVTFGVVYSIL